MEIQYFGANCIKISTKNTNVIIDDNLSELGLPSITKKGDIALFTGAHGEPTVEVKLVIDRPGEYEISDVSIMGFSLRAHMDEPDKRTATAYKISVGDISVFITGHIYPDLDEEQLENISLVDILIIPVGGNGYTLDGIGAQKIISNLDPKVVIPVHYCDKTINYPVEQQDLDTSIKLMGMDISQRLDKVKTKSLDLSQSSQLIVLEKQ